MKNRRWKKLLESHETIICPYCLQPIVSRSQLTIEHEPPLSRQSELGIKSKVVYACKRCNHEKGSLTAEEYKEWLRLENIRHWRLKCSKER